ncbi:AEC family transporter [Fictibacillus nanhaiensis]|uniref:AEC family transporter n=1 Tax=Fictibacillus nanhaiensis TaxID=742169 RepID=UPI001C93C69D|nr:AEC family transporter [Fictibacillus nanhaiensis]
MELLSIILPVFAIFAIGFIGQKYIGFETQTLSKMALYLMSPFLVFRTFYETAFTKTYVYMLVYTLVLCFVLIGLVYVISYFKKYNIRETCGVILASAFMNNGNYGTPVALFAFGAAGLDYAVVLMVIQQLVMCTVGIYYAAKGSPENDGVTSTLRAVVRMPILYGAIAGVMFQQLDIKIRGSMAEALDLVADSAIPTIMIILGMQLAKISLRNVQIEKLTYSLLLKLFVSPVIAYFITLYLPIDPMLKAIMILMAAMPSAANTTMYALQFGTEPDFVSSATLVSTLLSLVTLPVLLGILL